MNSVKGSWFVVCILGVSAMLYRLYSVSVLDREIYRSSFNRRFATLAPLKQVASLDLEYNSFYVAGVTHEKIYLGNYSAPFHLLVTDHGVSQAEHIRLTIGAAYTGAAYEKFRVVVDSPRFVLLNGLLPGIFQGKLNEWRGERFLPMDSAYFSEAVKIGRSSFALRAVSAFTHEYEIGKLKSSPPFFEFNDSILEKQVDGLFSVDGKLHFSQGPNRLVYLYAYRNQYVVMDTSLNVIDRFNTIDTFSTARVRTAFIKSDGSRTLAGLPAVINSSSSVSGKYLYIRSTLLARNEGEERFRNNSVVDVYDFERGRYRGSFYLPNYQGGRPSDFRVSQELLIAIFDRYLVTFDLSKVVFDE